MTEKKLYVRIPSRPGASSDLYSRRCDISEVKSAVDKECTKLNNVRVWDVKRDKSKADVFRDARDKKTSVHSALLLNLCLLKRAELVKLLQKM